MLLEFSPLVLALGCRFYCCWRCYYTTARVNAGQIFAVGVGVRLPILLLLVLLLHNGEGKCCSNFRRWCWRYAAHFTAVGVRVPLPKMFCWYLARMRTFTQLSDGDFVSFCGTNTFLLLVVGALQHYFCLPRSLTQRTPFWPRPPQLLAVTAPFASGFIRRGCTFVAEREAVYPLPPRAS